QIPFVLLVVAGDACRTRIRSATSSLDDGDAMPTPMRLPASPKITSPDEQRCSCKSTPMLLPRTDCQASMSSWSSSMHEADDRWPRSGGARCQRRANLPAGPAGHSKSGAGTVGGRDDVTRVARRIVDLEPGCATDSGVN